MDRRALALSAAGRDVLVLSDGVAGHDRASLGVVSALALNAPQSVRWLSISEVRPRSRRLARVAARFFAPQDWLARGVSLSPRSAPPAAAAVVRDWPGHADVVVSTGPSTAAANIAAARRYGAKNIYCGFPKWPALGIDLILAPVPSPVRAVALAPRPSEIDADALARPRPLHAAEERRLALLFGGDSKHYRYTASDLTALGTACRRLVEARPLWRLDAYDSRRTDAASFAAFEAAIGPASPQIAVHRFRAAGLGSNRAAFEADLVLVSADSLSMITEALAAGRPTLVVRAAGYRGPRRDRGELDVLAGERRTASARFDEITPETLERTPLPPRISQLETLAALLERRGF